MLRTKTPSSATQWPLGFVETKDDDGNIKLTEASETKFSRFTLFTQALNSRVFDFCSLIEVTWFDNYCGTLKADYWKSLYFQSTGIAEYLHFKFTKIASFKSDVESTLASQLRQAATYSPEHWLGIFIDENYKISKKIAAIFNRLQNNDKKTTITKEEESLLRRFLKGSENIYPQMYQDFIPQALFVYAQFTLTRQALKQYEFLKNTVFLNELLRIIIRSRKFMGIQIYSHHTHFEKMVWKNVEKLVGLGVPPYHACNTMRIPLDTLHRLIEKLPEQTPAQYHAILHDLMTSAETSQEARERLMCIVEFKYDLNFVTRLGSFLHEVIAYERIETAQAIIDVMNEQKLDFNMNSRDVYLRTPLILAAYFMQIDTVRKILAFHLGVDKSSVDGNKRTDTDYGKELFEEEKITPSHAVYINARDEMGRTALHYAMALGQGDIANVLIEHGADPSIQDRGKNTPYELALHMTENRTLKFLVNIFIHPFRDKNATANALSLDGAFSEPWRDSHEFKYLATKTHATLFHDKALQSIDAHVDDIKMPVAKKSNITELKKEDNTAISTERAPDSLDPDRIEKLKIHATSYFQSMSGITLFENCMQKRAALLASMSNRIDKPVSFSCDNG